MRILLLFTFFTFSTAALAQNNNNSTARLRHVVIFKFNDSSTPNDVKKVSETFAALYGKVPQIKSFEMGH